MQYKLILNTLYGKTYQALRMTGYDEEPELIWDHDKGYAKKNRILYRAGGLYLAHVGAWITSLSRAKFHEDMHRHKAIDCATDSFKTLTDVPTGKGLGDLKFVAEGLLLLIRPKLYVMFSNDVAEHVASHRELRDYLKAVDISSLRYPDDIVKYVLHGFWGNVHQLLELYRDKSNEYMCKHMTKIRESIRQDKNPRVFETQKRGLKSKLGKRSRVMRIQEENRSEDNGAVHRPMLQLPIQLVLKYARCFTLDTLLKITCACINYIHTNFRVR